MSNRRYNTNHSRVPPKIEDMVSLKVDNLTNRITMEDLKNMFERCGELGDIYMPRDYFTHEIRGFAFVRFLNKRDAENAIKSMDGHILDGREIRVKMARYGRPTSSSRAHRTRSRSPRNFSYSESRSRHHHLHSYSRSRSRSYDKSSRNRAKSSSYPSHSTT